MTKKIFFTLILVFTCSVFVSVNAKDIFSKGDQAVGIGIGIGSYYGGDGYSSGIPPISVSYERGIVEGLLNGKGSIGVGGYAAYTSNKWEGSYFNGTTDVTYGWKYNYIVLGARGAFHYQFVDKLDTYTGLMLGYNIVSSKYIGNNIAMSTTNNNTSGFGFSAFIGGRYHFSPKYAAYAEVGYGISALELGLSIRL
ncbi:MAG: hypothetical protein BGO29_14290 [Bacteroidales bacterium 36-12]|nr:MAG: hypothetical protein BGO29_14290 [Bacteroidales bacterium 36-12]